MLAVTIILVLSPRHPSVLRLCSAEGTLITLLALAACIYGQRISSLSTQIGTLRSVLSYEKHAGMFLSKARAELPDFFGIL